MSYNYMSYNKYTIFLCVKNDSLINDVFKYLDDDYKKKIIIKVKDNIKSFSEMVNSCINECNTEIFIFLSHRVSPKIDDILKIIELIDYGYGYVGLYRFACFGIHMNVIKKIGYFDENFISGGCEDDDFRIRLMYNNIAYYEDHSVEYRQGVSLFDNISAYQHFLNKYDIDKENKIIKIKIFDKINIYEQINKIEYSKEFLDNSYSVNIKNIWTIFSKNELYLFKIIIN